ncbi:MAG: hypothetical protein ACN4GZ_02115 [Acidimicrobiales bacterium]
MSDPPPPRLFGVTASAAPIVAVLRRGPSDWCQVSRWDWAAPSLMHGSWFRGTIPPQKCDLSPDGRWLLYSAVKHPGNWDGGAVYEAISRLPWLTALAAWNAGTTYTRGAHFTDEIGRNDLGEPDVGDVGPLLRRYGLASTKLDQFAVERRRGWTESPETPARRSEDVWDRGREVEMVKRRPGGGPLLCCLGSYAAYRESPDWNQGLLYYLDLGGHHRELDVQWADWSHDGRLLLATHDGRLQIRTVDGTIQFDLDLTDAVPDPKPPPDVAGRW